MFDKFKEKEPLDEIDENLKKFECVAKNCTNVINEL